MRWKKHGLIFQPDQTLGWMASHAQVPTALLLQDRLRVYFASRPQQSQSLTTYVDLDRSDPSNLLGIHPTPVLEVGEPGTFDADGVMPASVERTDDAVLLYYSGWSRLGGRAPYNNATGLAVSYDDGATFARVFKGPILDRAPNEPWSATSPAVIRNGRTWHMWYSSGTGWKDVAGKLEHLYVLRHATSDDGRIWRRDGADAVPLLTEDESQTRPAIIKIDDRWHMWFSFRGSVGFRTNGQTYRIGYAWSTDLLEWHRDDPSAGIELSEEGWDSQMMAYPDVVRVDDCVLMFYNGNAFGRDGFGYATLA